MTHTANHSVPEQGKFRRALAAVWAFLQAMEYTSFDYTLDRIERLEREVGRLKEELRQSRDPGAVDAQNASAAGGEHDSLRKIGLLSGSGNSRGQPAIVPGASDQMRLAGKVAWVTGAGSGIGEAAPWRCRQRARRWS